MIWSIVSKAEMEGFGTSPVFRFYREALGKENIRLAVVETDDPLDFVKKDDVVLLRTADELLVNTIEKKDIRSTAESYSSYELVKDKVVVSEFLRERGINVPIQVGLNDIEDGKTYFIKPRFGSDSFGITLDNLCKTKDEVSIQYERMKNVMGMEPIIEAFIDGEECTCACCMIGDEILTSAIEVECEETQGIQTRDCKVGFKECCHVMEDGEEVEAVAREVFNVLGLKHHARIDFRKDKYGNVYVLDVNLLPGLGPIDHFAKCFLLTRNFSYVDTMRMLVESAINVKK